MSSGDFDQTSAMIQLLSTKWLATDHREWWFTMLCRSSLLNPETDWWNASYIAPAQGPAHRRQHWLGSLAWSSALTAVFPTSPGLSSLPKTTSCVLPAEDAVTSWQCPSDNRTSKMERNISWGEGPSQMNCQSPRSVSPGCLPSAKTQHQKIVEQNHGALCKDAGREAQQ